MTSSITSGEFLVVEIGAHWYGVATAAVETVVARQPLTPLPFVPPFIEGLVYINERIVPQLDLALLLAAAGSDQGAELVLVETPRSPCALRVSRVVAKAEVAAENWQPLGSEAEDLPVAGRFEWEGRSVLALDLERIGSLVGAGELPAGQRGLLGRLHADADSAGEQTLDCVVVVVGTESYALALTDIVEILDLAPATPVPGAPALVEGLAMVRDEVLLVLALAQLLQQGAATATGERRSVVVVQRDDTRYGLRVDRLDGIRQLPVEQLRRLEAGDCEVSGVLADGTRLYGVLSPARLIGASRHRQLQPLVPRGRETRRARAEQLHTVLQVALGDEAFGIALAQVRRIAEYRAPERVQGEPGSLIAGAVNIEGKVLPVLDLAAQLQAGAGNQGAWVIVGEGDSEWAVAVREATGIVDIPESALERATERGSFVCAIANVQDRLLSLLTLAPLAGAATDFALPG